MDGNERGKNGENEGEKGICRRMEFYEGCVYE